MSNVHDFREYFNQLACIPPDTKIAQVRAILPQIEQARKEGKSAKQIWRQLSEDGLEMSYRAFTAVSIVRVVLSAIATRQKCLDYARAGWAAAFACPSQALLSFN